MKKRERLQMPQYVNIRRKYFEDIVLPSFERIERSFTPTSATFKIAGKSIQVKGYSPEFFERMTLALGHHDKSGDTPDLTIHIFDSASVGESLPAPWENPEYSFPRDSVTEGGNDPFFGIYMNGEETMSLYDPENKEGYFWTKDANLVADWVTAAPFRPILHWFLNDYGTHLIHGAIIGDEDGAVLLSAKSGAGKSTTAISCLLSGMKYLSDDYGAIEAGTPAKAHSLYNSLKILPNGFKTFPELESMIWNKKNYEAEEGAYEKGVIFLKDHFKENLKSSAPLKAILIPKITGKDTRIVAATKLEAMLALIPTTLFQLPLAPASKLEELKAIIDNVPCFFLELGPEVRLVPDVIKDFLKD